MTFLAAILSMRLPETANVPMPETIDDLDQAMSRSSQGHTISNVVITEDKLKLLEGEIEGLQYENEQLHA